MITDLCYVNRLMFHLLRQILPHCGCFLETFAIPIPSFAISYPEGSVTSLTNSSPHHITSHSVSAADPAPGIT